MMMSMMMVMAMMMSMMEGRSTIIIPIDISGKCRRLKRRLSFNRYSTFQLFNWKKGWRNTRYSSTIPRGSNFSFIYTSFENLHNVTSSIIHLP